MADRNLRVVADQILRLVRCDEIREVVDLEWLQNLEQSVSEVSPYLADAESKSFYDRRIEFWVTSLGKALVDVEISLELLKTEAVALNLQRRSIKGCLSKMARLLVCSARLASLSPSELRRPAQFAFLADQRRLLYSGGGRIEREIRVEELVVPERGGFSLTRHEDKSAILEFLFTDVKILAVVGRRGVGKTMLARDVFDDKMVQTRFHWRIWVTLLSDGKVGELIVESETGRNELTCPETPSLIKLLEDYLSLATQYLIVIDNASFNPFHPHNSLVKDVLQGSRILLIFNDRMIWKNAVISREPYNLRGASEEEGWSLFGKTAFRGREPKEFQVQIGKQIANKCQELPVAAVIIIGSMLYFEESVAEWDAFYSNELIPAIEEQKGRPWNRLSMVDRILELSYGHLQSPLKHCLVYCSLFPRGFEFDVQTLIKLWIANGFVDDEDVGYSYFLNLLGRSFFCEAELDYTGRAMRCKMHYSVHQLSTTKAGNQCQLLAHWPMHGLVSKHPSHVSFESGSLPVEECLSKLYQVSPKQTLRSLLFPTWLCKDKRERSDNLVRFLNSMGYEYTNLRALDVHGLSAKTVPSSIGKLILLRYLDLSENKDLTELPDSITELLNLQTLRLSSCFRLKKLPRDIGNLVNLRHLEIDECFSLTSLPRGFGRMTNLRTLSQIILSENVPRAKVELDELKQLSNLREVRIKNLKHGMGEQIGTCLRAMPRVRSLSLEWESRAPQPEGNIMQLDTVVSSEIEEFAVNRFWSIPGSSFFPSVNANLVKLTLRRVVKCKILPPLEQCSKLKVLVVDDMMDLEFITSENSEVQICPWLRELWLTELPKLMGWWRTRPSKSQKNLPLFPCLSKLVIEDCPQLDSMPLFPNLEQGLILDSTSWEPFELTMKHKAVSNNEEASSSSPSPLSKLKNLCIVSIENFDHFKAEEIAWDTLTNLQVMKFDYLPKLKTLPEGLQQVTCLRVLHIWRCCMTEIPVWIAKLKFLEKLVIRVCPSLKSLPEEICGLKLLHTLEIEDCPTLLWRCRKETGADWNKVAHIPDLRLGRIYT